MKKKSHPEQLSLFPTENTSREDNTLDVELTEPSDYNELFIPRMYEELVQQVGNQESKLSQLIRGVPEFEEPIVSILSDIHKSGLLLLLYGEPGVGKSTFITSLRFAKHIPIRSIYQISADEMEGDKLKSLIQAVKENSNIFFREYGIQGERLCIVFDYLETLEDQDESKVNGFFRDLNAFLRKNPVLIIWPITDKEDLESLKNSARKFSSTIFHRNMPVVHFTGPSVSLYPEITKNTISICNSGRDHTEYQITDDDLNTLREAYENKPANKQLIRDYLVDVKQIWEKRSARDLSIAEAIPKLTEVWFIFAYPDAENVVAQFTKRNPKLLDEMWNADYDSLYTYVSGNTQKSKRWTPRRLSLALKSSLLTTKIIYMPTNALVSCVAAYSQDVPTGITRADYLDKEKYGCLPHYLRKSSTKEALKRTPLYRQLIGERIRAGKRKSGTVRQGLENARQAFEEINKQIWQKKVSDQKLNKALALALQDTYKKESDQRFKLDFSAETYHPVLGVRPDILISKSPIGVDKVRAVRQSRLICIEVCYTNNGTPGEIARYVLEKLDKYMTELQHHYKVDDTREV
ncbi:hypothetical protein AY600_09025 [Phormidium willei BDU 130791]|nr:hypothetical protein AY600_09025 [Phormidium willei BDU 130791]